MKKNRKKEVKNPIIKNQKKIKNMKINNHSSTEDENVIKKLIIIIIAIAIIIGIIYGVTELIKKEPKTEDTKSTVSVNYDKVTVGTLLNRPYDEYYVLVYNSDDSKAVMYSTILTKYMNNEDNLKVYFCDLNNKINNSYYNVGNDNKSNVNATKIEDFDFGDLTLIKIKKGSIVKYIEDFEQIKEILK